MKVFDRIKILADDRKKSINDIEDEMGYSRNTLYRLKRTNPSSKKLEEIADYFNVSTDYLLGRTNDKSALSNAEKMDVGHRVEDLINGVSKTGTVNFYGEPMTDEDKLAVRSALEVAVELAKKRSKLRKDGKI